MGLVATELCWKFLDSVSESKSPSAFLGFYEAVRHAAIDDHLVCSNDNLSTSKSQLWEQIMIGIGKSLGRHPNIIPSVGHTISIQGETWQVFLDATAIPHLKAAVVENTSIKGVEAAHRFRIVLQLVKQGEIDFCKIEQNQLFGKTWELYLFCKIQKLRLLRKSFSMLAYRNQPVLLVPDRAFSDLTNALPNMTTLKQEEKNIRAFMDECDQIFMKHIGLDGLTGYLGQCGLSPKEFLRAQKPSLFGTRT